MTLDWSVAQCGLQFCESWLCKLALVSLSFILDINFFLISFLSVSLSVSLSTYLSLSLSLSIVMFEFEPLYKKEKKGGEREKIIYFFWFCMAALLACMRIRMGTHG